jgi:hypothetical protein
VLANPSVEADAEDEVGEYSSSDCSLSVRRQRKPLHEQQFTEQFDTSLGVDASGAVENDDAITTTATTTSESDRELSSSAGCGQLERDLEVERERFRAFIASLRPAEGSASARTPSSPAPDTLGSSRSGAIATDEQCTSSSSRGNTPTGSRGGSAVSMRCAHDDEQPGITATTAATADEVTIPPATAAGAPAASPAVAERRSPRRKTAKAHSTEDQHASSSTPTTHRRDGHHHRKRRSKKTRSRTDDTNRSSLGGGRGGDGGGGAAGAGGSSSTHRTHRRHHSSGVSKHKRRVRKHAGDHHHLPSQSVDQLSQPQQASKDEGGTHAQLDELQKRIASLQEAFSSDEEEEEEEEEEVGVLVAGEEACAGNDLAIKL